MKEGEEAEPLAVWKVIRAVVGSEAYGIGSAFFCRSIGSRIISRIIAIMIIFVKIFVYRLLCLKVRSSSWTLTSIAKPLWQKEGALSLAPIIFRF